MGCSPSLLSRILAGERPLDSDKAHALLGAMRLDDPEECAIFLAMARVENAPSEEAAAAARRRLDGLRAFRQTATIPADAETIAWPGVALLELLRCPGAPQSPDALAELLVPPTQPETVSSALEELSRLGLIERMDDGRLVPVEEGWMGRLREDAQSRVLRAITTGALERSVAMHRDLDIEDQAGGAITLTLPASRTLELRLAVVRFLQEVAALADETSPGTRVVEVAVHAHPLSRKPQKS